MLWLWLWDWATDAYGRQGGHGEARLGADGCAGIACAVGAGRVEGLCGGAAVGRVPVVDCRGFGLDFSLWWAWLGVGLGIWTWMVGGMLTEWRWRRVAVGVVWCEAVPGFSDLGRWLLVVLYKRGWGGKVVLTGMSA